MTTTLALPKRYIGVLFRAEPLGDLPGRQPTGASGSWTNQGLIIESRTSHNFNSIEPSLLVDASGRWWMTFGSFRSGIKQIPLDGATGKRSGTSIASVAGRNGGAAEAPFVFRHGSHYYLWVSFDLCCKGCQ